MTMLEQIASISKHNCLLKLSQPVVVGVSGGPDSLSLLDILSQLEYPLIVVHLDHGLRPESGIEAVLLKQQVEAMGMPLILGKEDVEVYAETHSQSIEEAARILRYRLLFSTAREHDAQAVAVGHTADDQVETVLMHLLRGAGLSGLQGMSYRSLPNPWSQDIPLVRPLLSTWREQIQAYVAARNLKPFQDSSNMDIRYYRNRLRHELIPLLETYNPGIRPILWRTADILREDYAVLEALTQAAWEACINQLGAGFVAFEHMQLKEYPLGVQRQLVRKAINHLRPGLRDIDFDTVDRALDFLRNPPRSSKSDLASGLRLLLETDLLWIASWEADLPQTDWPQLQPGEEKTLEIPGTVILPGGWQLSANHLKTDLVFVREQAMQNSDPFQAWIDGQELHGSLKVHARCSADRFKPLGMNGHSIKLSDFMVNVKLPQRVRDNWPLVYIQGEIVWVPGFRLAHPFRIKSGTRQIVHLQLTRS